MGSPQHTMEPSAPLVTTNSELHFLQEYRLPVSLANFHRLLTSHFGVLSVNTNSGIIISSALGAVNEPRAQRQSASERFKHGLSSLVVAAATA